MLGRKNQCIGEGELDLPDSAFEVALAQRAAVE